MERTAQDLSRTGAVERDVEQVLFSHLQSFLLCFDVVICVIQLFEIQENAYLFVLLLKL